MQLTLQLDDQEPADLYQVAILASWLYQRGHAWTKAAEISKELPDLNERAIRKLAAASAGIIVSGPGCPGYKHIRNCDPEQARTVANRLQSQAKLMSARAGDILSALHRAAQ